MSSYLVIKPGSFGDVVNALPAIAVLRKEKPESRISWLIDSEWAPLLAGNRYVDEIVAFPGEELRGVTRWPRLAKWVGETQRAKTDLVLDFDGALRSALIARLCRDGAKIYGLSDAHDAARLFYDHVVKASPIDHAVERNLRLVAGLDVKIDREPVEFPLPPGEPPRDFRVDAPFLLLHPFARDVDKSLSHAEVAAMCGWMAPVQVVLAGKTEPGVSHPHNCVNLLNKTSLSELIWLIRYARFVVSVESGPMHLASALTDKLLAVQAVWRDPKYFGPYNPAAWVWHDGQLFQMKDVRAATGRVPAPQLEDMVDFVRKQVRG
jgi:ADP-heptose:LPS heptosyltransferase